MANIVSNSPFNGEATIRSNVTITTNTSSTAFERASALHGETFKTDPVFNFLLYDFPTHERRAFIPEYMHMLMKLAQLNSAIFDEADWSPGFSSSGSPTIEEKLPDSSTSISAPLSSAVWMPPGKYVDNWRTWWAAGVVGMMIRVGIKGTMRTLGDIVKRSNAAKKKALTMVDEHGKSRMSGYWYLFMISTDASARGQGVGAQVIQRMQAKLQEEADEANKNGGKGFPIWLEATTASSRRLYSRLGFQDVEEWVLGKGEVDETGESCSGGKGVTIWGMVWWPI